MTEVLSHKMLRLSDFVNYNRILNTQDYYLGFKISGLDSVLFTNSMTRSRKCFRYFHGFQRFFVILGKPTFILSGATWVESPLKPPDQHKHQPRNFSFLGALPLLAGNHLTMLNMLIA